MLGRGRGWNRKGIRGGWVVYEGYRKRLLCSKNKEGIGGYTKNVMERMLYIKNEEKGWYRTGVRRGGCIGRV